MSPDTARGVAPRGCRVTISVREAVADRPGRGAHWHPACDLGGAADL